MTHDGLLKNFYLFRGVTAGDLTAVEACAERGRQARGRPKPVNFSGFPSPP